MVTDPGVTPPDGHLANGWANNSDGGGYAFIDHVNNIVVRKGLMSFDAWMDSYEDDWLKYGEQSPFILHFRIGTHGPNDAKNTHPHVVNKRLVVAHNGIIRGVTFKKKDARSDTRVFIDNTLRLLPKNWLDNPAIRELVADRIGKGNKLAFLSTTTHERVYILNEEQGVWGRGVWYSNDTYLNWRRAYKWYGGWEKGGKGSEKDKQPATATATAQRPFDLEYQDPETGKWLVEGEHGLVEAGYECPLCGERLGNAHEPEPWCWSCHWCAECDQPIGALCECEEYKDWIAWDDWGDTYLAEYGYDQNGLIRDVDEVGVSAAATRDRSLHDLTDEEWMEMEGRVGG
jgi:hypothetical protein